VEPETLPPAWGQAHVSTTEQLKVLSRGQVFRNDTDSFIGLLELPSSILIEGIAPHLGQLALSLRPNQVTLPQRALGLDHKAGTDSVDASEGLHHSAGGLPA
jgi:hypothetical protein